MRDCAEGRVASMTGCDRIVSPIKGGSPFVPSFTFGVGDGGTPPTTATSEPASYELASAAMDYDAWAWRGGRGQMPEFGEVIRDLCADRVCIAIDLGGCIWFESRSDADLVKAFFAASPAKYEE